MTPALGLTVYHPDKADPGYTLLRPLRARNAYLIDMQGNEKGRGTARGIAAMPDMTHRASQYTQGALSHGLWGPAPSPEGRGRLSCQSWRAMVTFFRRTM